MNNIIIVGTGGLSREIYQWMTTTFLEGSYKFKGFMADQPSDILPYSAMNFIKGPEGYVVGTQDRFINAIGDVKIKKMLVALLKEKGAIFLSLIHPSAIVSDTAKIGEGVVICPYAIVSDNSHIDDFVLMNYYASCGHDSSIGKYSNICPYAAVNGYSEVGDEVFMGTHSTVIDRKKVGRSCKINANSVVMHDVPPQTFVYGVPGKFATIYV